MAKQNGTRRTSRKTPPENETPAQAFKRLGNGRVNRALHAIGLVGQLAGPAYESSEEQQRAIVAALQAAVESVDRAFKGEGKASDQFRLPE